MQNHPEDSLDRLGVDIPKVGYGSKIPVGVSRKEEMGSALVGTTPSQEPDHRTASIFIGGTEGAK